MISAAQVAPLLGISARAVYELHASGLLAGGTAHQQLPAGWTGQVGHACSRALTRARHSAAAASLAAMIGSRSYSGTSPDG